jgi:hypothetical protein
VLVSIVGVYFLLRSPAVREHGFHGLHG